MEHQLNRILALLLTLPLSISACKKLDLVDMIVSDVPVNQRFEQSDEWNALHPFREIVVPSDDYLILSLADCHVGGTKNLDLVLGIAKTTKASAVVMAGDLTSGYSEDYSVFQQHLPNQDSLPTFQIAGNHDLFFDGWNEFHSRFGSSTYIFTVKTPEASDLYICLDTGGGTLGNKQLDWLTNILETERPDYRHCILFTHNNLFRPRHVESTNLLVEELQVLIDLFTRHRVEMVITGHDHKQDALLFGITTYIILDPLVDGADDPGYLQLCMKNSTLEYEFMSL
ncbi:MAG: metallophosphoesterase [Bacteroidales bacterium]|nr:metallophosphoesterase [Bacteroidales bacterium]